jgi:hypothetical protein
MNLEEKLAYEIASTLGDIDGLSFYENCTRKYSESHLRSVLTRVMSIPSEKIKRTRGALFTFLITQHAKRNNSPRN